MVSESHVTNSDVVVFLGLSILELGPMYATDTQIGVIRQTKASLNASALWGGCITMLTNMHARLMNRDVRIQIF